MMKISKLLKVCAFALLAASLCFVSCKDEDDTNDAFSGGKVDFDNSYVIVSEDGSTVKTAKSTDTGATANTTYYYRAFNQTTTKHRGGIVEIKITPNSDDKEGVAGFVFDLTDGSTADTYNFCVAAVDYSKSNGVRTYVSRYTGTQVKNNNFTTSSNFSGTETSADGASSKEWTTLSDFSKATDGTVTVVIKVGTKADQTDGSYTVGYYTNTAVAKADGENDFSNAKKTVTVTTANTDRSDAKTQTKLAYYAGIMPGKHFTVNFDFGTTYGSADEIAFADETILVSE